MCCVLDSTIGYPVVAVTAFVCTMTIFTGIQFFGYRTLVPAGILAIVVRLAEMELSTSLLYAFRDLASAGLLGFLWQMYRSVQPPVDHHPFDSDEFEALLSAIPDVIVVFDRDGRYREIFTGNPGLLVRPEGQLIGQRVADVLGEETANSVLNTIRSSIDDGVSVSREDLIEINGEKKWFLARVVPFSLRGEKTALWVSREITKRKHAIQQQQKDEEFLRQLLRLQDRERKLISSEIHDGVLQHVVVAHLIAQVIARDANPHNKKVAKSLVTLQTTLTDAIREGRGLIQDLRPLIVDESGIVDALTGLIQEENQRGEFNVSFQAKGDFEKLPQLLEGSIYRIVQEALNNIRRHSQADSANVSLIFCDENVELRIQDNGVGFDDALIDSESFGLKSIRNRAELFGGVATISSSPGNGTKIFVSLPTSSHDTPSDDSNTLTA
jgi:signal transduction histidine kinase